MGEHVAGAADHVCGKGPQAFEQQVHGRTHGPTEHLTRGRGLAGGAGHQLAQVLVFGIVESQDARQAVEHRRAGTGFLALFDADVVVDAHPGQGGQFLAAQAGGAAQAGADRQADVARRDPAAPGPQEPSEFAAVLGVGRHIRTVSPRVGAGPPD